MQIDTKFCGVRENEVICSHCGKTFSFDEETCEIYRGKFICADCFQTYYGYCNECGKLHLYSDMNDDIVCKECEK